MKQAYFSLMSGISFLCIVALLLAQGFFWNSQVSDYGYLLSILLIFLFFILLVPFVLSTKKRTKNSLGEIISHGMSQEKWKPYWKRTTKKSPKFLRKGMKAFAYIIGIAITATMIVAVRADMKAYEDFEKNRYSGEVHIYASDEFAKGFIKSLNLIGVLFYSCMFTIALSQKREASLGSEQ